MIWGTTYYYFLLHVVLLWLYCYIISSCWFMQYLYPYPSGLCHWRRAIVYACQVLAQLSKCMSPVNNNPATGDKWLSKPMMAWFTATYMNYSALIISTTGELWSCFEMLCCFVISHIHSWHTYNTQPTWYFMGLLHTISLVLAKSFHLS